MFRRVVLPPSIYPINVDISDDGEIVVEWVGLTFDNCSTLPVAVVVEHDTDMRTALAAHASSSSVALVEQA